MLFISAETEPGAVARRREVPWPVVAWLLACCALVFAMVVLGGVTRLTESGLSIVDWRPVTGVIPPLNEAEWQQEFEAYQQFPEFRYVNRDMDLAGFKVIFLFEYAHRLLGRLIGVVFLLPMLWFWWRGVLTRPLKGHLSALFVLGALQGLLGWYMVMSGLVDEPRVSQYRLTAHLLLAVLIYGYMLLIAVELVRQDPATFMRRARHASRWPALMLVMVLVMIASGGFVAGTHAGYIYNSFPDMHGQFIPDGIAALSPWWRNAFENVVTIQFNHRMLAYVLLVLAVLARVAIGRAGLGPLVPLANLLLVVLAAQAALGIVTLLNHVPVSLGAAHQGGALVVFTVAVLLFQRARHIGTWGR